jgi:DNA polymerase-3 subunit beta
VQSILNNDCNVRVGVDATNATFTTDLGEVVCRLPVGKYPNFRAILPQNYEQFVTVKRNLLSSCISRCTLCASSTTQMLALSIKNDKIIVQSENIEFNKSAKEECVIEDTNIDEFKIGINSSTFVAALNAINSDVVTLKFNTPTKPIEFIDGVNERKTVICMPLQL